MSSTRLHRPSCDVTILRRLLHAPAVRPSRARRLAGLALAAGLVVSLGSCAYYNTFYTARKYYDRATQGSPYLVDPPPSPDLGNLNKSMDYSKKLMANYPRSKWVDDAYLLWARAFLAKNDPIQTADMLVDFSTRYPNSPLIAQAGFYRAVALRQARRYDEALKGLDEFIKAAPKSRLLPYAYLERARTLRSLDRDDEAAASAGELLERWPKSPLAVTARVARAEANLDRGATREARADFHFLGLRSRTDDERLGYLLRESECLESGRDYPEALSLLRDALGHETPPEIPDTTGGKPRIVPQTPGYDRYGRLLTRIGTVQLMSGDAEGAIASYRRVVDDYPHTPVSAEAQYRLGYAYEVGSDDFDQARVEYGKVRDEFSGSPFVAQATQRLNSLDQLARFRSAGGDSTDRQAQGAFLLAEQYLFQLDKPDRALTEYGKIATQFAGSAWAGKALNAQAWVLLHKFQKTAEAESLFWKVVHEYPATEAQLAARDYLEGLGQKVPADLIQLPAVPAAEVDTTAIRPDLDQPLTQPPASVPALGPKAAAASDSMRRVMAARSIFGGLRVAGEAGAGLLADSVAHPPSVPMTDSTRAPGPPPGPGLPASELMTAPAGAGGPDSQPGAALSKSPGGFGVDAGTPIPPRPGVTGPVAGPGAVGPVTGPGAPPPLATINAPDSASRGIHRGTLPDSAMASVKPPAVADSLSARGIAAADSAAKRAAAVAMASRGKGAARADSAARAPLPPLELSPVVPGITFPLGPPRTFGAPELASTAAGRAAGASPLLGQPSRPLSPADSLRAVAAKAARDSVRAARGPEPFRPRGSDFQ